MNRPSLPAKHFPAASLLLLLCACVRPPSAPAPSVAPPSAPSEIVLRITLPLANVRSGIERQVPKKLSRTNDFEMDAGNRFGAQYVVERDPVRVGMRGDQLQTVVRFRYAVRACHRTPTGRGESRMWPCIACGFDEPLRGAVVILDSILRWDPAMFVRSTTSAGAIEFFDRCRVSSFRLDITDWKVRPFIDSQVRASAAQIDAQIREASSVMNEVRRLWSAVNQPVEVSPGIWLVLAPEALRVGPLNGDNQFVRTTLTVIARPRLIVGGSRPAVAAVAVPPVSVGETNGSGFTVPFSIDLPFREAEPILQKKLKQPVRIERADGGRITFLTGSTRLSGRPVIIDRAIAIPDLDYRVRGVFRRAADVLRHSEARERLREKARWDLTPMLETFRRGIEKGLQARQIDATVAEVKPTTIHVLEDRFVIDAVATGSAEFVIRQP